MNNNDHDLLNYLNNEIQDAEEEVRQHNKKKLGVNNYGYGWMTGRLDTLRQIKDDLFEDMGD